ncbi:MAG TPA: condensation domain-containing protein, partial [Patescibacteria group bacterium]|nr:condensation domain-containing protein [Patescibacteria group bacterium]
MAHAPLNSLKIGEPENSSAFEVRGAHGPYPLSHSQEELWFIEQLAPGTPTYNLPEAWRLKGRLDIPLLQHSLDAIVTRHETLRTFFSAEAGKPRQFVLAQARIELGVFDLTQHADRGRLEPLLQQQANELFDLGRAPLARASLFRLAEDEHILLLNLHHIISDAWSQGIFIRELVEIYTAALEARTPELPQLPVQYADFALWQKDLIASEAGAAHLAYWQNRFGAGAEPVLLPADHPRSRTRTFRGATRFYRIHSELVQALTHVSRQAGVTLFMTLLAGFKALLHRYTGINNILVGSPMACRERLELEPLLGFFVHTQPLLTDLSGDPSFEQLLGRVREVALDAYAHQDVSCQLAVQSMPGHRSTGSSALFQVVFGWQSTSPHNWTAPGLAAEKIEMDTGTAKFDWTVLVSPSADGLLLRSEFSTDLFETSTAERLMRQFLMLLEGVVRSPQSRISELPLQSETERAKLLIEWNRTESNYGRELQIQEIFEAQAASHPDAIALVFGDARITYSELNRRANQLAHRLESCGVASGARVALCLDRSLELIIAILAILKTGGAYVPLDPDHPQERLQFMLRDCGIAVLLTQKRSALNIGSSVQTVICLDELVQSLANESEQNLPRRGGPEALAYVMYTSGSTGTSKGVLIPHRAVVRLVRNTNYLNFCADQVFLQLAPVTFDASTFEIWGP